MVHFPASYVISMATLAILALLMSSFPVATFQRNRGVMFHAEQTGPLPFKHHETCQILVGSSCQGSRLRELLGPQSSTSIK